MRRNSVKIIGSIPLILLLLTGARFAFLDTYQDYECNGRVVYKLTNGTAYKDDQLRIYYHAKGWLEKWQTGSPGKELVVTQRQYSLSYQHFVPIANSTRLKLFWRKDSKKSDGVFNTDTGHLSVEAGNNGTFNGTCKPVS
jgi:hypothetical protein